MPLTEWEPFLYIYTLQSETDPRRFYTGCAHDLRKRLAPHNRGDVPHTSKWKPWLLKTYIAFPDNARARSFEHYLKPASERAFTKRHL
ncbi:MAG: GIY-YIG nuclease family protein [Verrucomicrobiota bacterium]